MAVTTRGGHARVWPFAAQLMALPQDTSPVNRPIIDSLAKLRNELASERDDPQRTLTGNSRVSAMPVTGAMIDALKTCP
jgi:hypothetical protein